VAKLDRVFSICVRKGSADAAGIAECYTCGKRAPWRKLQAGHFQSRRYQATRWTHSNCKPQCGPCNLTAGEQYRFARRLDKEHGPGYALQIENEARHGPRPTDEELAYLLQYYVAEARRLTR